MAERFTNKLANETSPYLLQHANNPVEWYPWHQEALARALEEDKPILLSIGYSACHWCHVMAHESFEDIETAEVMNELFINIKIDREERPDLDKIYQLSHQMLTQRAGGWPLTLFLTPDKHVPFFAGTYFPKQPRYNMPDFVTVLESGAAYYRNEKAALDENNSKFIDAIGSMGGPTDAVTMDFEYLRQGRNELAELFDSRNGGFGQAPKFPHATDIEFLLHYWHQSGKVDSKAFEMAELTLLKMAEGGIYDQLGGGFCRYSVDAYWSIPHFEKMLYDNGPLLSLYSQVWRINRLPLFKNAALESAQWALREMQSAEGGYYSSLDADSEGEEGKYYRWDRAHIRSLLTSEEFQVIEKYFAIGRPPNFENHWHLVIAKSIDAVATSLEIRIDDCQQLLSNANAKLLAHRETRIRPGRDEKILTAWNALMAKGMTICARTFKKQPFLESAERSMDFIESKLWRDSRLLATYKDGKAHLNAYLDDYAYTIDACLEILQTRWRTGLLRWAIDLADVLLEHFEDRSHGGFFFTSDDHEALIHRPKPMMDESIPAGNGIAASALARLGHLIGDSRYVAASRRVIEAASSSIKRVPHAHGSLLIALKEQMHPANIVVLRGDETIQWHERITQDYSPNVLCFVIPDQESELPGLLGEHHPNRKTTAYVCTGSECLAPIFDINMLQQTLSKPKGLKKTSSQSTTR